MEQYICFGDRTYPTNCIIRNRNQLDMIPCDVEDILIYTFDTTDISYYAFNGYQFLQSLVLSTNTFWRVTGFDLKDLPSLKIVVFGKRCCYRSQYCSLTGY